MISINTTTTILVLPILLTTCQAPRVAVESLRNNHQAPPCPLDSDDDGDNNGHHREEVEEEEILLIYSLLVCFLFCSISY